MTVRGREVIFEFRRIGEFVKVSAVDTATNTEVSITGSPRMSQAVLKQAALRKLRYVIAKGDAGKS